MAVYAPRRCPGCGNRFTPGRANQEYHSKACGGLHRARLKRASAKGAVAGVAGQVAAVDSGDGRASARRGHLYEVWCAEGWPQRLDRGELSIGDVVTLAGTSEANVSRWLAAWREDSQLERQRAGWGQAAEVAYVLAPWLPLRFKDLRADFSELPVGELNDLADGLLDAAVVCFSEFRAMFFRDEWGDPYRTPEVHRRWVKLILRAMLYGRRQLILSPPRHGKTDLLRHMVIWLICRFPNIRIMWIGGNESVARNATGSVLDELEHNAELIAAVLGPGRTFKPPGRGGASWSAKRATVATRTGTGIKSATLVAIGKGGKLLSLDADLIIPDDVVDGDSVHGDGPGSDFEWFNKDVSSRKQDHTAVCPIGSRRDHHDLWGRLETNKVWTAAVEHAHDPACDLPTHPFVRPDEHDPDCPICGAHVDCMLFPEIGNTFAWLQDQRASYDDDVMWEMVYQNITHPDGADPVTMEHIKAARDVNRRIGELPRDEGINYRLIAGLDPATSGFQASVLWAVELTGDNAGTRHLVDLDNDRGGGPEGFRRIVREWFGLYGCQHWVFESTGVQSSWGKDRDVLDFAAVNGIRIDGRNTGATNYYHPEYGIPKHLTHFKRRVRVDGDLVLAPLIRIPYGDPHSQEKVRVYEDQVRNFEPGNKKIIRDLLMAGAMPEQEIKSWLRGERPTHARVTGDRTDYDSIADGYERAA